MSKAERQVTRPDTCAEVEKPVQVILDAVPEGKKKEVEKALMVIRSEMYSGPIPPPEALDKYEQILPGAADRILKMAETQMEHRISIEGKVVNGQVKQSNRGQIFGFIVVFACIAVAAFFAYFLEMKTFAATFLTVTMVTLVGIFVTGKASMKKDLDSKSKDMKK